jgi:hypothetical protein
MMLGREMTLPIDVLYGSPDQGESEVHEYTTELKLRLDNAYRDARKQIESQHKRQKRVYDQRHHGRPFEAGDFAWVYNPRYKKGLATKLSCNWSGPYLVIKRMSDTIYRIQKNRNVIHYDSLKLYSGSNMKPWPNVDLVPKVIDPEMKDVEESQVNENQTIIIDEGISRDPTPEDNLEIAMPMESSSQPDTVLM